MIWDKLLAVCLVLVVAISSGCEHSVGSKDRSYGDSLVVITYHTPAAINSLTTVSGISALLMETIFDGLIRLDENLKPMSHLASSWHTSDDGLKWTFYLRRGVKFHDGVEYTAEDVKFTIEQLLQSNLRNLFAGGLRDVQSIHIKDRYTIEIILKKPSMFFLYSMDAGILPAHILKRNNEKDYNFGHHPVGTGPFKLTYWGKEEIVLEANKDYFSGRPYLDRIVVKIYPNQEMAWVRLMQGKGDFLFPVNPAEYSFLKQLNFMEIYRTSGLAYFMIALNNDSKLFKDIRVRRALNYAIGKEHIIQNMLKGNAKVAASTIWPGSWAYNSSIRPYQYDPHKALSLLKEAGWKDGDGDHIIDKNGRRFTFTLLINEGDERKVKVALYIQQQLWELGILMDVKTFSPASMDFLFQGKFDAQFIDIFPHVYPDFNYIVWHSSQIGKGVNICRYKSDVIDRLLEKGHLSMSIESAKPIYYRFQQEIHDNPPGIFLYWPDDLIALHKRFKGVRFTPVNKLAYINEWYVPEEEQSRDKRQIWIKEFE